MNILFFANLKVANVIVSPKLISLESVGQRIQRFDGFDLWVDFFVVASCPV